MRVYGTIKDARKKKPLNGALITLSIGDTYLIEDTPSIKGEFSTEFSDSALDGDDDLLKCEVKKKGYTSKTVSHRIVDEETQLAVELAPIPIIWPKILRKVLIISAIVVFLILLAVAIKVIFFPPKPPLPEALQFIAQPAEISSGKPVLLEWKTAASIGVFLDEEKVVPNGSVTVHPTETTVYTLVVKGEDDEQVIRKQQVVIVPPPKIVSFTAEPPMINQWESTIVSWETVNAAQVYITTDKDALPEGSGAPPPPPKDKPEDKKKKKDKDAAATQQDLNGSVEIFPVETATYTLIVVNKVGETVKKKLKVKVIRPPSILSFIATDTEIVKGQTSILSWDTDDAVEVYLNNERTAPKFSKEVAPEETTTYTLVVKNQIGERQKKLTIQLPKKSVPTPEKPEDPSHPPKINEFLVTPLEIGNGQSSILHWVTENADQVFLDDKRVDSVGSYEVFPKKTTYYEIKAVNEVKTVTWRRAVVVKPTPCTVILYGLENYKGESREFTTDALDIGSLDNAVSSIKIIGNCAVKVYSAPNFKATYQVFTRSIPRLRGSWIGNNTISSLKIIKNYGE